MSTGLDKDTKNPFINRCQWQYQGCETMEEFEGIRWTRVFWTLAVAWMIIGSGPVTANSNDGEDGLTSILVMDLNGPLASISLNLMDGPLEVATHTPNMWKVLITATNEAQGRLENLTLSSVLPAEIEAIDFKMSKGKLDIIKNGKSYTARFLKDKLGK